MDYRRSLIRSIQAYTSHYAEERAFKAQFLQLLEHPRAFFRDHLPGHITGSAWIVDQSVQYALLTHHAKLKRWLQPGGHADGDEDVGRVAKREALEETGLTSLQTADYKIFDLDIHAIPARADFPAHLHYDIRFLFKASKDESFSVSEESIDLAWIPLKEMSSRTGGNDSILRMVAKSS